MKFTKTLAAGFAATAMLASGAAFADYPEKPIKIMVGFSAGGGTGAEFHNGRHHACGWHTGTKNREPCNGSVGRRTGRQRRCQRYRGKCCATGCTSHTSSSLCDSGTCFGSGSGKKSSNGYSASAVTTHGSGKFG